MAKGRKVRASRAAQGYVEFSHFPPAVHFDLMRKQEVVIPALSREFFASSEISASVNLCVMEAIKLCRLDTPIIFIEARLNLSRFVVTGCAATTSATVTFPSLNLISLFAFCFNIWLNGVVFFQAEVGIRDATVTGVQTCALPISSTRIPGPRSWCAPTRPAARTSSSWM